MKPMAIEKVTKFYVNGQEFESEEEAEAYRVQQNVGAFFGVDDKTAAEMVERIKADPDGFKEIVQPLMPKRRRKMQPVAETKPASRGRKDQLALGGGDSA